MKGEDDDATGPEDEAAEGETTAGPADGGTNGDEGATAEPEGVTDGLADDAPVDEVPEFPAVEDGPSEALQAEDPIGGAPESSAPGEASREGDWSGESAAPVDEGAVADDPADGDQTDEPLDLTEQVGEEAAPVEAHQATVFQPRPVPEESTAPPLPLASVHDGTVFQPSAPPPVAYEPTAVNAAPPPESAPPAFAPGLTSISPAVSSADRVEVGSVLNGLYEVTRFIARGGMGEVWEGRNVNDEHDRVAIKVVLPSLAADPAVQAMFRKEARTLKRLMHKAVVQYRVIASDPRLNILYIVTDYVDGVNLADVMPTLKPDAADLRILLLRLAEGLRAAHEIGAIHRDMSPDNVILEDGRLDRARIIDFGVAKDLDPAKGTIVGDGFAGKLGFVAPEQFGDFGRDVGAWTDVYSLALVILAVAQGRNPDMGATLVDAVDRRRQGIDVSAVPETLRPVLAAMLVADPAHRLRSMDAVLEAVASGVPAAPAAASVKAGGKPEKGAGKAKDKGKVSAPALAKAASAKAGTAGGPTAGAAKGAPGWLADPKHRMIAIGGGALAVVAVGALVLAVVLANIVRRRDTSVEAALTDIPCSWMAIDALEATGDGVALRLSGAAGDTGAAQAAINTAVAGANVAASNLDLSAVQAAPAFMCRTIDGLRPLRRETSSEAPRLSSAQTVWAMEVHGGRTAAYPMLDLAISDPTVQFALLGLDIDGLPVVISSGRRQLQELADAGNTETVALPGGGFRTGFPMEEAGFFGVALLTGSTALDPALLATPEGDPWAWFGQLTSAARAAGWEAEIVWLQVTPPAGT